MRLDHRPSDCGEQAGVLSEAGRAAVAISLVAALLICETGRATATNLAPPMFDVARQCDASSRHNVRAMSECVVAESEARAELLQSWSKFSDKTAETCIKAGRRAKRLPYSLIAKCLSVDTVATGGARPADGTAPQAK